jgi:hypothetical protein
MEGKSTIHYKFKTATEYNTVTLDGEAIRVFDIKAAIVADKRMDKGLDNWDLEIQNEQTKEGA